MSITSVPRRTVATTPLAAIAVAVLVGATACGGGAGAASESLDEAMAAVCGGAEVETVEPEPAEDDRPASEAARDCVHGDIVGGDVFVEDPADWLGDRADGLMTGDGIALSRATKEVDGRWIVVQATTTFFRSEDLAPLEDLGFDVAGGEDPAMYDDPDALL